MTAMPPPLPCSRGELRIEKLSGVRELRVLAGESGDSQVSVRARISRELSSRKSCIRQGLLSFAVVEQADRILRQLKEIDVHVEGGPGFSSTSPERRSSKIRKNEALDRLEKER